MRLVGLGISGGLDEGPETQPDLFAADSGAALDPTIVTLRERFGSAAIGRASLTPRRRDSDRPE